MGLTYTINNKPFGALASANGAYALHWDVKPAYKIVRYQVMGVNGSYVNHCGLTGYTIKTRIRYISLSPYADFTTDEAAWEDTSVAIAGPDGHTYSRCLLNPMGMSIVRDAVAMGRGVAGQQFLDAEAVFTADGGRT